MVRFLIAFILSILIPTTAIGLEHCDLAVGLEQRNILNGRITLAKEKVNSLIVWKKQLDEDLAWNRRSLSSGKNWMENTYPRELRKIQVANHNVMATSRRDLLDDGYTQTNIKTRKLRDGSKIFTGFNIVPTGVLSTVADMILNLFGEDPKKILSSHEVFENILLSFSADDLFGIERTRTNNIANIHKLESLIKTLEADGKKIAKDLKFARRDLRLLEEALADLAPKVSCNDPDESAEAENNQAESETQPKLAVSDTSDTSDASDTSDTSDTSDASDTSDTSDTSDASDIFGEGLPGFAFESAVPTFQLPILDAPEASDMSDAFVLELPEFEFEFAEPTLQIEQPEISSGALAALLGALNAFKNDNPEPKSDLSCSSSVDLICDNFAAGLDTQCAEKIEPFVEQCEPEPPAASSDPLQQCMQQCTYLGAGPNTALDLADIIIQQIDLARVSDPQEQGLKEKIAQLSNDLDTLIEEAETRIVHIYSNTETNAVIKHHGPFFEPVPPLIYNGDIALPPSKSQELELTRINEELGKLKAEFEKNDAALAKKQAALSAWKEQSKKIWLGSFTSKFAVTLNACSRPEVVQGLQRCEIICQAQADIPESPTPYAVMDYCGHNNSIFGILQKPGSKRWLVPPL